MQSPLDFHFEVWMSYLTLLRLRIWELLQIAVLLEDQKCKVPVGIYCEKTTDTSRLPRAARMHERLSAWPYLRK
jgi:hypothetical protein